MERGPRQRGGARVPCDGKGGDPRRAAPGGPHGPAPEVGRRAVPGRRAQVYDPPTWRAGEFLVPPGRSLPFAQTHTCAQRLNPTGVDVLGFRFFLKQELFQEPRWPHLSRASVGVRAGSLLCGVPCVSVCRHIHAHTRYAHAHRHTHDTHAILPVSFPALPLPPHSNFGVSMTIAPQPMTDGVVLSFLIAIPQPDGLPPLEVQACLDDETFIVQRQLDGFGKEVAASPRANGWIPWQASPGRGESPDGAPPHRALRPSAGNRHIRCAAASLMVHTCITVHFFKAVALIQSA